MARQARRRRDHPVLAVVLLAVVAGAVVLWLSLGLVGLTNGLRVLGYRSAGACAPSASPGAQDCVHVTAVRFAGLNDESFETRGGQQEDYYVDFVTASGRDASMRVRTRGSAWYQLERDSPGLMLQTRTYRGELMAVALPDGQQLQSQNIAFDQLVEAGVLLLGIPAAIAVVGLILALLSRRRRARRFPGAPGRRFRPHPFRSCRFLLRRLLFAVALLIPLAAVVALGALDVLAPTAYRWLIPVFLAVEVAFVLVRAVVRTRRKRAGYRPVPSFER